MADDPLIVHFDQSTWLAHRANEAAEIGDVPPSGQFALPGALAPIDHDSLVALTESGRDMAAVVDRVNSAWLNDPQNRARVQHHRRWVTGQYDDALTAIAEAEAQERAKQMERSAKIQQRIQELREARGSDAG